jgi:hypothetical protein
MKLQDVEEGSTFGFPAFKFGGKAFAWFPKKKDLEPRNSVFSYNCWRSSQRAYIWRATVWDGRSAQLVEANHVAEDRRCRTAKERESL